MSLSLRSAIQAVENAQNIQLATAINELPATNLIEFIKAQQEKLYNRIKKIKDGTLNKVYGDLERATQAQESILMHHLRTNELKTYVDDLYKNQEGNATNLIQDKNNAKRKFEINEWAVGNKYDTLFVLSSLFILVSSLILLTVLWRLGFISSSLWASISAPLIIIFIIIVIRRSQYTNIYRNKRWWNKKRFEGEQAKISISCPTLPSDTSGPSPNPNSDNVSVRNPPPSGPGSTNRT
jgi:hypothetical protein